MAKIKMNLSESVSETFEYFLISKRASGLIDKTLYTYKQHFKAISKIIDVEINKL